MQPLSAYKKHLKPAILEEASKRFCEYGIRAVKMDDIAKGLSVSKRTIYEIYDNKEEMLIGVITYLLERRTKYLAKYSREGKDSLDILLEVLRLQIDFSARTNTDFFKDLKKYPEAEKILDEYNRKQRSEADGFFIRGVEEGYFRSNINYEVFQSITAGTMKLIRTSDVYKDLTYQELYTNFLCVVIRGICTERGVEKFDEFCKRVLK